MSTSCDSTLSTSWVADCRPATVLIVDDERNLRQILGQAMEIDGYQILEASTGEACLGLCEQELPNLILLDAIMPNMDGFTCCDLLQSKYGDRCPPVLIITALSDPESVDRAFAVGATDYVTKPINWPVLRQRVRRILQTQQSLDELRQARQELTTLKSTDA